MGFFLFPHMTLPESDFRHLSILLPPLSLLQVVRPPAVPHWAKGQFPSWPAIPQEEMLDLVNLNLRGYREFASVHGANSTMASISHEYICGDQRESRLQIQSTLKGQAAEGSDLKRRLLIEAAIFLEMARDLDEKVIELEGNLLQVDHLEEEFREILGISEEEDLRDLVETSNLPLVSERGGLFYMLPKRIAFWIRMFSTQPHGDPPTFVTVGEEIMEEILEPLEADCDHGGKSLIVSRARLAEIPSVGHLSGDSFASLLRELEGTNVLSRYLQNLESFLQSPGSTPVRQEMDAAGMSLRIHLEDFCKKEGRPSPGVLNLILFSLEGCSLGDICASIDPGFWETAGEEGVTSEAPVSFLCLC